MKYVIDTNVLYCVRQHFGNKISYNHKNMKQNEKIYTIKPTENQRKKDTEAVSGLVRVVEQ